jgi:hypothetical protein
MKKARCIWLEDLDYNKLRAKAREQFQGKGYLERYLESIANNPTLILKGDAKIKIEAL